MARRPPLARIHVNQHVIRRNLKEGAYEPAITIKQGKTNTYVHGVEGTGPWQLLYPGDRKLSCGARIWFEVRGEFTVAEIEGRLIARFGSGAAASGESS